MTKREDSNSKTISIVGAGPGGLFLAILLRQHRPDWSIRIWERNAPDATFGFGVVFSDRTVEALEAADPTSLARIRADFQSWSDIEVATWRGVRRTGGHGFSAIARHRLLAILQQRAADLGIEVEYNSEAPDLDMLYASSDLVVGADGINSRVRAHWADEFNTHTEIGNARFIWFATPRRYDALTFHFVDSPYGPFSTHAYPFSKELSTFIVEVDTETWRRAGLDRDGLPELGIGESDERAMRFCEEIFAESLQGEPLVGNASQWRQFPTVRNGSWTAGGKVVILGDAAHTAHFSVGSGTKMAMEDAAALAKLLVDEGDPQVALREYPKVRKPQVEKIQALAEPSRGWWENFHLWVDRDPDSVMVNFLTRTGRETTAHLERRDSSFTAKVLRPGMLKENLSLPGGVELDNRRGLALSADREAMHREVAAIRASGSLPGLLVATEASPTDLTRIQKALGTSCPPIICRTERDDARLTGTEQRLALLVSSPEFHEAGFAVRITTPSGVDKTTEWKSFVESARKAEEDGATMLIIEPSSQASDSKAVAAHAGVVLRPAVDLPMAVANCDSEAEALTHLNAERADIAIGKISHRFVPETYRQMGLDSLLRPTGVVVVGASQDPTKAGNALMRNLGAFPGVVEGVGRSQAMVDGRKILDSVDELDSAVDLAIVAVPSKAVPSALEQLSGRGVRAAVVCSGGFAETGEPDGIELQADLDRVRQRNGMRILGPNTSGIAVPPMGLHASFVPAATELCSGSVAVLAQSGGVAHATALALHAEGIGIAAMIGTGNACDIDLPELTRSFAANGGCSVIALHLEGSTHGRDLLDAIEQASESVPVVVLKSGVSDVDRLSVSHTGALTGDWSTASALLAEAGAVVVPTLGELVDAVAVMTLARLQEEPDSYGVGVVTGQAGPGILLTDRLQTLGLRVPDLTATTTEKLHEILPALTHRQNPVDTGRPGEDFADVVAAVAGDPEIAVVATYVLLEPGAVDLVAHLKKAREQHAKPIIASSNGIGSEILLARDALRSSGIPLLINPERAANGVWALFADRRSAQLRSLRGKPTRKAFGQASGKTPRNEAEAKQQLTSAGFTAPLSQVCDSRAEARDALARILTRAQSVVVKISSPEISHKAAVGGVHLGITNEKELQSALDALDAIPGSTGQYLIEEQVNVGTDIFVSARKDSAWGTIGLIGLGGTDVEERGQVDIFALPTSAAAIRYRLRNLLPEAPDIAQELLALYETLEDSLAMWPDAGSFEVNPLRITDDGLIALDALVAND